MRVLSSLAISAVRRSDQFALALSRSVRTIQVPIVRDPEEGCSVAQGAAELTVCFKFFRDSQLSVYPNLLLRLSQIALGLQFGDLHVYWIIVRASCSDRQPHSLVPNHRDLVARHDQDDQRQIGMQWMARMSYCASQCSVGAPHRYRLRRD